VVLTEVVLPGPVDLTGVVATVAAEIAAAAAASTGKSSYS